MASFFLEIAGRTAKVDTLFDSTRDYFRAYLTDHSPHFSISVTREDLLFEQADLDEEAHREGFRLRRFTDPFLERASIQRSFAEHLFDHDTLLLHGSAVAVDGQGYLFTAKSGTGKSTHTRLWREVFGERAVMVNDDKPFAHISEQGVTIFGSPWSGKHGLDTNIAVPLKGICILTRGAENKIAPISPADTLPILRHECYQPLDEAKRLRFLALVDRLAQRVPLWHMQCNKEPQAALTAWDAMSNSK